MAAELPITGVQDGIPIHPEQGRTRQRETWQDRLKREPRRKSLFSDKSENLRPGERHQIDEFV
jgi:hypothetical protein